MQTARLLARAPLPYLAEATALYNLLRDGHDRLRFHISRGHALRQAATGQVELASYVEAGRWLPARDVHADGTLTDRTLSPHVLARHLAGKYDVAWEAPSWSSLVVFDIDCHVPEGLPAAEQRVAWREALLQRDQVLARLWRAFGFNADKQPVILQTPGNGYHVYLPLLAAGEPGQEGLWPNACARRLVEAHLWAHDLALVPGTLELFPAGVRLRAPCGRGMLLLEAQQPADPDNLQIVPVPGTYRGMRARGAMQGMAGVVEEAADGSVRVRPVQPQAEAQRNIPALVAAFLARIEAARRPLHAWLGAVAPLWDATWGPFGRDRAAVPQGHAAALSTLTQHKEDVLGSPGLCPAPVLAPGRLLQGPAFLRRIVQLTQHGLIEPGQRHDAALKLTFYFGAVLQLPRDEVLARVEEWLHAFAHASATYLRSARQFVHDTLREAAHYYDHHVARCAAHSKPRRIDIAHRPLAAADLDVFQAAVAHEAWPAVKAVLAHLKGQADAAGVIGAPVDLSHHTLLLVCGDRRIVTPDGQRRRAYVVALEELARLGVLTLHTNYSTGRHGRRFSVWYRFGSGLLPERTATGARLLGQRALTEGTLLVLAPGDGSQEIRLEPRPSEQTDTSVLATPAAHAGWAWWQRMLARRLFTVAELLPAQERSRIPGLWTWRRSPGRGENAHAWPPEPPTGTGNEPRNGNAPPLRQGGRPRASAHAPGHPAAAPGDPGRGAAERAPPDGLADSRERVRT